MVVEQQHRVSCACVFVDFSANEYTDPAHTPSDAVEAWYGKLPLYDYTQATFDIYTQGNKITFPRDFQSFVNLVWKDPTTVGCGSSVKYLVCRFCGIGEINEGSL